jgi:hypothetical protein
VLRRDLVSHSRIRVWVFDWPAQGAARVPLSHLPNREFRHRPPYPPNFDGVCESLKARCLHKQHDAEAASICKHGLYFEDNFIEVRDESKLFERGYVQEKYTSDSSACQMKSERCLIRGLGGLRRCALRGLDLNPHPPNFRRVRHPKAFSMRDGAELDEDIAGRAWVVGGPARI